MRQTFVDAGWGALVTLVLSISPFPRWSAVPSRPTATAAATRAGCGSGRSPVPLLVLFVPSLYIAGLLGFGIPPSSPGYGVFLALVFAFFLAYTVGLSAVGGVGGVWARHNTEWDLDPVRWL